jgi:hypothetical protein
VVGFFAWCAEHRLTLPGIEPVHVATSYVEQLAQQAAADVAEGPSAPANQIEVSRPEGESSGGFGERTERARSLCLWASSRAAIK